MGSNPDDGPTRGDNGSTEHRDNIDDGRIDHTPAPAGAGIKYGTDHAETKAQRSRRKPGASQNGIQLIRVITSICYLRLKI
jgi:hypothetical protein